MKSLNQKELSQSRFIRQMELSSGLKSSNHATVLIKWTAADSVSQNSTEEKKKKP